MLYAGIPALRHDWNWPRTRLDFFSAFTLSTSGWFPIGFGFPHPNPSGYLASPLIDAAGLAVGPSAALWIYLAVAGALCAAAGWALASAIAGRDRKLLATAAAVVATFNPWVYNQIVAGHTYMIVAYAAAGLLLALLAAREDATSIRASLLAVLAYVQLQIFLVLACVLAVIALQRRRWLAVATVVVVALPTAIGIAGEFGGLARTPITLPWEENQSVQPLQALVLGGYFADYASQFDGFGQLPLAVLAALAVAGAIVGRRSPRVLGVLAATLTTIVAASGANGPLAFGFSKLVLSTPLVGLYRELYDLLGFAALGFLALALVGANRSRILRFALIGIAACLPVLWFSIPPARHFVDARAIPPIALLGPAGERFALEPAFQPLSFEGRGSGADPDAGLRAYGRSSLNEYVPSYPVDAALASYERYGDVSVLAALGVREIVDRPGFETDSSSLRAQLGSRAVPAPRSASRILSTDVTPLVGVEPLPRWPALLPQVGAGRVFFADSTVAPAIRLPMASNAAIDPAVGWVDLRLQTIAHPRAAFALGGTYTQARNQQLPVEPGEQFVLAAVDGRIATADGRTVARGADAPLRWLRLPAGTAALACDGACGVAAFAERLPERTAQTPVREIPLAANFIAPWLAVVDVPAAGDSLLRLNARFDDAWQAFAGMSRLHHVRVDATSNGWVLGTRSGTARVLIVDVVALFQALAEVCGALWTIGLIAAAGGFLDRFVDRVVVLRS